MLEFLKNNVQDYKDMMAPYLPNEINFLFILESPPYPGDGILLFFYNVKTPSKKDTLFRLFMRAIYNIKYGKGDDKNKLLLRFKDDGYFLLDAVGYPINRDTNGNDVKDEIVRCQEIDKNKSNLLIKLRQLKKHGNINKNTKIVLIKKSVFNTLYKFLKESCFPPVNQEKINYPNQYDYNFINDIHQLIYDKDFKDY